MKTIFLIILTVFLNSCFFELNDYNLDRKYDLIFGVLTPDSLREYQHEIFVGKITPSKKPPDVILGEDPKVNLLLLGTRGEYWGKIVGDETAKVVVKNESGEEVKFTSVGNGFYRDVNDDLKVYALKKYNLEVQFDNKTYTSETQVPGDLRITNISENDTLVLPKIPIASLNGWEQYTLFPKWSDSEKAFYYRMSQNKENLFKTPALYYTFYGAKDTVGTFYPFEDAKTDLIESDIYVTAIDTNYGFMHKPEGINGKQADFDKWYYSVNNNYKLGERTSIEGGKDVAGCFGSYNLAFVKHFVCVPEPE